MKQYGRPGLVRLTVFAWSLTLAFVSAAAPRDALFQVRVGRARDAFSIARAIEGAARPLEGPRCRELRRLLFYSGEGHPRCRTDVLAWTTPGSRVVYVCSARLREGYLTNPARLEAVVLHEMLHTLGLGEDPPTSEQITARVVAACLG